MKAACTPGPARPDANPAQSHAAAAPHPPAAATTAADLSFPCGNGSGESRGEKESVKLTGRDGTEGEGTRALEAYTTRPGKHGAA